MIRYYRCPRGHDTASSRNLDGASCPHLSRGSRCDERLVRVDAAGRRRDG